MPFSGVVTTHTHASAIAGGSALSPVSVDATGRVLSTLPSTTGEDVNFLAKSSNPRTLMRNTAAAVNQQSWDWITDATRLIGRTRSDADTSGFEWISVTRAGVTPTEINFPNGTLKVGGATVSLSESGTYTPTLTADLNCTTPVSSVCQWMRVGNTVTVSGRFGVTVSSDATNTRADISLPVASNFTATNQAGGTSAKIISGGGSPGTIIADTVADRVDVDWFSSNTGAQTFTFIFTYAVV